MNYLAGDLILTAFPYASGAQAKVRPALVLLDMGDVDVLVARVTTKPHRTPYDVTLTGWRQAGLRAPSVVRLHKVATLEKNLIVQTLGRIGQGDRSKISAVLQQTFGSW